MDSTILYKALLMEPNNMRQVVVNNEPLDENKKNSSSVSDEEAKTVADYRHKCTKLELRLAEETKQHNNDIGKLHQKISKLQSSFEKNELLRHKLEYQLTLSQQETNRETRKRLEYETEAGQQIAELKKKLLDVCSKLESSEESGQQHQNEILHFKEKLSSITKDLQQENSLVLKEKLAVEQKNIESNEKCEVFEKQLREQSFTIQKLIQEGEYASSHEQELTEKMRELQIQIKALEDNVEAERAAHLETKFNTEVIQLNCRDTEHLFKVEKAKLEESRNNLRAADEKYRLLVEAFDEEKESSNQLKTKLTKAKENLSFHKHQVVEKDQHLTGITAEVNNYSEHLKELVEELEQTKEKLTTLEKEKQDTTREMEFLINNYKSVSDISPVKKSNKKNMKEMFGKICLVLDAYQEKLMTHNKMNEAVSLKVKKLEEECIMHRKMACNKNKALEEAERLVKHAQDGLSKCQVQCASYEERLSRSTEEMESYKKVTTDKNDEIISLKQQLNKSKMDVLAIYDSLMRSQSHDECTVNDGSFTVNELKEMILNRIQENRENEGVLSRNYDQLYVELKKDKENLQVHKTGIKKLQKLNTRVLTQTEKSLMEGQQLFEQEKRKYTDQILLLESKLKVYEEQREEMSNLFDGVSFDKIPDKLSELAERSNKEKTNPLVSLLQGVFWGLLFQFHAVLYQKKILLYNLKSQDHLKEGIVQLVSTLEDEMSGSRNERFTQQYRMKGIFRFRKFVIAVLAFNRFVKLQKNRRCVVLHHKPSFGHNGLIFFTSMDDMSNNNFSKEILLTNYIHHNTVDHTTFAKEKQETISQSYANHLQKLSVFLRSASMLSFNEATTDDSLLRMLGNGLQRIMYSHSSLTFFSSEMLVEVLRSHLLDFTKRLGQFQEDQRLKQEQWEKMKKKYCHQMEKLHSEAAISKAQESTLREKIFELEERLKGMTCMEHFENVCIDLKNALVREEDLQKLFDQNILQIKEMEKRIERNELCFDKKSQELDVAWKTVRTSQHDLKLAMEKVSHLKSKQSEMKQHKQTSEKKMSVYIKERELLARFLRQVTSLIYNATEEINQSPDTLSNTLNQLLTQGSTIEHGEEASGPSELRLVENVLKVFLHGHQATCNKLTIQRESLAQRNQQLSHELVSHKTHIRSLRQRVSALFQQDLSIDGVKDVLLESTLKLSKNMGEHTNFIPLQER